MAPVPHRQYVFTLPKMLRVYFRKDRRLLGKLSQCAAEALKSLFRAGCKGPRAVRHPRRHPNLRGPRELPPPPACPGDRWVFTPTGWFVAFPKIDLYVLEHLFRHRVLQMLLGERRIDETLIRTLLGWRHSGFSLHNAVRIGPHDIDGHRAVSEYHLRSPFSLEKLRYHPRTGTVIYRSKMHPVLKRNVEVFSACDWLAALTAHIPNAGEHLVRYYGWYSNVNRGKRRKAQGAGEAPDTIEEFTEVSASAAKRAWARLITQVSEVDPLICPRCTGPMRLIA